MKKLLEQGGGAGIGSYVIVVEDTTVTSETDWKHVRDSYNNAETLYLSISDGSALLTLEGKLAANGNLILIGRDFENSKKYTITVNPNNEFVSLTKEDMNFGGSSESNPKTATKGQIIRLDITGSFKPYKVLAVNGSIVKLTPVDFIGQVQFDGLTRTTTFDNGATGLAYADSDLDNFAISWYTNNITPDAKTAFVDTNRVQKMFKSDASGSPAYILSYHSAGRERTQNVSITDSVAVGNRKVYAMGIEDMVEYFGTEDGGTFTDTQERELFRDFSSKWMADAVAGGSACGWYLYGCGYLIDGGYGLDCYAVPLAFNLDLSKLK